MKNCPKCQASVSDTAKFCVKCGFNIKKYEEENAQREYFCAECGTKFSGGTFCPECGYDVSRDLTDEATGDGTVNVTFDIGAISQMANDQLFEKEGFIVENGVLMGYNGNKRSIVIHGVEEIYDGAFENNELITFVEIEEGVKIIGKRAFANCKSLVKINIPESVEKIYDDTFDGVELEKLILPKIKIDIIKLFFNNVGKILLKEAEINECALKANNEITINIKELKDSLYFTEKFDMLAKRRVGESLMFGSYYLKNSVSKEPVEWIVLSKEGGKLLLISKYALDRLPYNESNTQASWENCSLRKWLDNELYENAFDSLEQSIIIAQGQSRGLFCLSEAEVEEYLINNMKCPATGYTKAKNAVVSGECVYWWTSSNGSPVGGNFTMRTVDPSGKLININVFDKGVAVRPAMWVNLEFLNKNH